MSRDPLDVLIIGGGVGGLCLAQGLRRAGVGAAVRERDASPEGRRQGYRLRISPEGEEALRACLPPELLELLVATSNERENGGLAAFDQHLAEQWAPSFDDPRGDRPDRIDAVDRVTLRRVLLAGLGDAVRFGKTYEHFTRAADGRITAHFADGTSEECDVLVAADGTNSRVRAQVRPWDTPKDLGVRTVFSRIPRRSAISAGLPEFLRDRFSYVIGTDGHHLGLMPMVFRTPPTEAAARLWPDAGLADAEDYYMSVFNVHRDDLGMTDEELFALSGAELCRFVSERTAAWHPHLRGIFGHALPEESFAVALRATTPVEPWEPGPVVALGDAVHTMPPSGGVGANTAVRDAQALTTALSDVAAGRAGLAEAVGGYQDAMVKYATEGVQMSLKIAQWSIKKVDVEAA